MFASTHRSPSHGRVRSPRIPALLLVVITLLAGTAFMGYAAAATTTSPVEGDSPEGVESGCFASGGQPFEVYDAEGLLVSSHCNYADGATRDCDWVAWTCTYDDNVFVHPTLSGPMGDVSIAPNDLGGVLDEPPPTATQPPGGDVSIDPNDLGGVLDEEPPAATQPPAATEAPAEMTMEPTTELATEAATEAGATATATASPDAGSSGGTSQNAPDSPSGQSVNGQESASLTIVVVTCDPGYNPFALDADPAQDCLEPTSGVPFTLTGDGSNTTRSAGDDGVGTARFEQLAPGVYRLTGQPPNWGGVAFVHDCVSSVRSFDDAAFFPLAMVGPTGTLGITLMPGEALDCNWYQVAAGT